MLSVKCVVVGDSESGKTCSLLTFVNQTPPADYDPNRLDVYTTTMTVDGVPVTLTLQDTAGSDTYDDLRAHSYRECNVAVVMFSLASQPSLDRVLSKWAPELRRYRPDAPVVLAGTHADLGGAGAGAVAAGRGRQVAEAVGAVRYLEICSTSQMSATALFVAACRTAMCRQGQEATKRAPPPLLRATPGAVRPLMPSGGASSVPPPRLSASSGPVLGVGAGTRAVLPVPPPKPPGGLKPHAGATPPVPAKHAQPKESSPEFGPQRSPKSPRALPHMGPPRRPAPPAPKAHSAHIGPLPSPPAPPPTPSPQCPVMTPPLQSPNRLGSSSPPPVNPAPPVPKVVKSPSLLLLSREHDVSPSPPGSPPSGAGVSPSITPSPLPTPSAQHTGSSPSNPLAARPIPESVVPPLLQSSTQQTASLALSAAPALIPPPPSPRDVAAVCAPSPSPRGDPPVASSATQLSKSAPPPQQAKTSAAAIPKGPSFSYAGDSSGRDRLLRPPTSLFNPGELDSALQQSVDQLNIRGIKVQTMFGVWLYQGISAARPIMAISWPQPTEFVFIKIKAKGAQCYVRFFKDRRRKAWKAEVTQSSLIAVEDSARFFVLSAGTGTVGLGFYSRDESSAFVLEFMKKMYEASNYKGRRVLFGRRKKSTDSTSELSSDLSPSVAPDAAAAGARSQPGMKTVPTSPPSGKQKRKSVAVPGEKQAASEYQVYHALESRFQRSLEKAQTSKERNKAAGNVLRGFFRRRPSQEVLVDRGILRTDAVAPAVAAPAEPPQMRGAAVAAVVTPSRSPVPPPVVKMLSEEEKWALDMQVRLDLEFQQKVIAEVLQRVQNIGSIGETSPRLADGLVQDSEERLKRLKRKASRTCILCNEKEVCRVAVPCGHATFCATCIESWLESGQRSCPTCHTPIGAVYEFHL